MENKILGLHHITAIAANAKKNFQFYTEVLGLRLVKKTVNFDDPCTYHFYFGDETGTPGTILTFFPWEGIGPGRTGTGMATGIGYSIPPGSIDFWASRFDRYKVGHGPVIRRFGEQTLSFTDPDGLKITLIEPLREDARKGWETHGISSKEAMKGFHSIVLNLKNIQPTSEILTGILGYRLAGEEGNRHRFITDSIEQAAVVDLMESPQEGACINAAGTIHHVAFRVQNEEILMNFREKIAAKGIGITQKIDRDYFFSLYFREPGGVLFELATDNPGFATDETVAELGSSLRLPKQYEPLRARIEAGLPGLV